MDLTHRIIARIGGAVLLVVGVALAVSAITVAVLSIVNGTYGSLIFSVFLGLLSYGCFVFRRRLRAPAAPSPVFPPETSLLREQGFTPSGFRYGIEILNDDRTPMEFVVSVLCKHLGLSEADAVRTMLSIHQRGGILLPRDSLDEAKRIAEAVEVEARGQHHSLICRAVSLEDLSAGAPGDHPLR